MAFANGAFVPTSSFTTTFETTPAAEKVRRHPKYYLNGGDVHFLVESYIFRVHRYFFERESQIFREKLGAPPPPGQTPKGSSDANPFSLDDVREIDFSRFLWVFYNPKYSVYDANAEEWISIMKLASEWKFAEVKRLSTRYLEKFTLEPVRKIELYQWYDIDRRLLIPSYIALVNRQDPLSLDEGRRLSLETALLIATARECARGKLMSNGQHSPVVATVNTDSMINIVKEVFALGDISPASPSLDPISEGAGPSVFTATLMSPSRIITSPPPVREDAMSPTPASKGPAPQVIGGPVPQLQPLVPPTSSTPPQPFALVQPKPVQAQPIKTGPSVPSAPAYLSFSPSTPVTTKPSTPAKTPLQSTVDAMKEASLIPGTPVAAGAGSTPAAAAETTSKTGAPPAKPEPATSAADTTNATPATSTTTAPGAKGPGGASAPPTEPKEDPKAKGTTNKDVQKSDGKPADNKSGGNNSTKPSDSKASDPNPKPTEPKPADPKSTEPKPADPKSTTESKPAEPEPATPSTPAATGRPGTPSGRPATPKNGGSRPGTPSTPAPADEPEDASFGAKWLKKANAARAKTTAGGGQTGKKNR